MQDHPLPRSPYRKAPTVTHTLSVCHRSPAPVTSRPAPRCQLSHQSQHASPTLRALGTIIADWRPPFLLPLSLTTCRPQASIPIVFARPRAPFPCLSRFCLVCIEKQTVIAAQLHNKKNFAKSLRSIACTFRPKFSSFGHYSVVLF